MCCDLSLMHSITNLPSSTQVALPTGVCISGKKSGSVELNPNMTLHDVLYVPTFHYNLLFQ